jgi:hypothetical protein
MVVIFLVLRMDRKAKDLKGQQEISFPSSFHMLRDKK